MNTGRCVVAYGPGPDQAGDLHLPERNGAPLVCLLHGGFWRMPYGRGDMTPIARDLCGAGLAVWNLEYRRVGPGGHPWPATFEDIDLILAHLDRLPRDEPRIARARPCLVGHSAGGHLAFWAASRPGNVRPAMVIGLAPILDLHAAHDAALGNGAVASLLGGPPDRWPDRYQAASPRSLLPLGVRQVILHGDADHDVPLAQSEAYARAARTSGDDATCVALTGTDHMAFLDPSSVAHATLRRMLLDAAWPASQAFVLRPLPDVGITGS